MPIKYCALIYLLYSGPTLAGNPLKNECDKVYFPEVFVQSINVISNWQDSGPAINVKVNNIWYAKTFSDSANDGFYQLAYDAYKSQKKVNVCAGDGMFRGIELN